MRKCRAEFYIARRDEGLPEINNRDGVPELERAVEVQLAEWMTKRQDNMESLSFWANQRMPIPAWTYRT